MKKENVTRLDVVNFISHGISKLDEHIEDPELGSHHDEDISQDMPNKSPLEIYGITF